jgi:hypothetical protein
MSSKSMLRDDVAQFVDYLMFVGEAPLPNKIEAIRLRRKVCFSRSNRQQGAVAAAIGPRTPLDALSLQLHDLLAGFRRHPGPGEKSNLCTDA